MANTHHVHDACDPCVCDHNHVHVRARGRGHVYDHRDNRLQLMMNFKVPKFHSGHIFPSL